MAKYDKNNAEKWLNEHHFGYYNNEHDKGTGAEEIPTINRIFEAWDDEPEWLTADPVDQDREHANLYGGDREYCDECGRRLTMGEWGGYCSHCHPEYEDYEDEYLDDDDTDSEWELIDRKNVEDSDGFITEYSWYQRGDEHVMVFGDSDLYRPEDGDYDAEFDSEERAREWFSSYEGFTDHNEGIDKDRFNCLEDECAEEKPLNEAKTYMGIPNTEYIYHGDWADPEIYVNGKSFNYYDVEEYLWGDYEGYCADKGEHPSDEGFADYCKENGETLIDDFFTTYMEFISAKEIIEDVKEYADNNFGEIVEETNSSVDVFFDDYGDSKADIFIEDLEKSYLGERGLIKCEKSSHSIGDINDADDYENEVLVRVTATPNSLSECALTESVEDEDKPFTKSQIRDELRRETQKWTKKSDEIFYGFESEYDYALTVLKKHYKDVEGEEKGDRYVIKFSNPNKGLKEGWAHFEFTSDSNPYIAKTEEEKKRLCNKWGKDCEFKGNINGNDYYVINDKPVENDFAPLDENKEDDLYDYKTRQATGSWDRDDDDYLLNQEAPRRSKAPMSLQRKASIAYENGDDEFFTSLSDDELVTLWVGCSIDDGNPYGAAYDDEVYDAIAVRPNSRELFDRSTEIIINKMPMYNLVQVYARYYNQEPDPNKMGRERIVADVLKAIKANNLTESKQLNEGDNISLTEKSYASYYNGFELGEKPLQTVRVDTPNGFAIQGCRIDHDKKTFDRGQYTVGADYTYKSKREYERFIDRLVAQGYEEIPSSYGKLTESHILNEGPGAGYTLEGEIKVTGIETLKPVKFDVCNDFGYRNSYDVTFDCVGVGTIEDFKFDSYMYGDTIDSANIDISAVRVNLWKEGGFENIEEFVKSNLEDIKNCIVGARVESSYVYGGGYIHSKFDGTICDIDEILNTSYSDEFGEVCTELFAMDATIRDTDIIEYVDKAVTGDNYYDRYEVMVDGDCIEDFDNEPDAIEYAKKDPDADEVVKTSYHELFNGDIDIEESETVWEREDDDFEESFKSIPGGKAIMESLVKTTLENYPNASSKVIARKTFDKSFEKHNITFEKWHKLVESVNK